MTQIDRQRQASARAQEFAIEKRVPVLYLDLDGTVRQGKDDALGKFVNGPEDVVVFPEAVAHMRAWKHKGGRIIAVSNQGGVALGLVSYEQVAAAMRETARQCQDLFDKIAWCVHHPSAEDPEMARCWCRKPSPGYDRAAAELLCGDIEPNQSAANAAICDRPRHHDGWHEGYAHGPAAAERPGRYRWLRYGE
jgi:histidinol phosphatase-like enzyme